MRNRYKVALVGVVLAGTFALGRYSSPVVVKTEIKTVEVEKKVKDKDTDVKKKKKTKKVVITHPDGSKEETTETETDTDKQTKEKEVTDSKKDSDTKSDVEKGSSSNTTISAIVGIDFRTNKPVYGASIYKDVVGPFGIGIFGLTNETCGVNIGIKF